MPKFGNCPETLKFLMVVNETIPWEVWIVYSLLAVSIRLPDGDLSRFALEFSWRLRASVRSFISIHQVAAATAPLLLLMLLRT